VPAVVPAVSEAEAVLLADGIEMVAAVDIHVPVWAGFHAGVCVAHLARARVPAVVVSETGSQSVQRGYGA
jgi:hypothetical protein